MPETCADVLIGRQDDVRRLDALLRAAREGRGGALVLRGEPGIGKSALLRRSEEAATGFLVMRASGAEFEMELPFAALHQLLAPVTGRVGALPAPHREALEVAFGLGTGTPDPFLVGVASLGLLVETVRERPLLCVVDDAQWLDRASAKALAFLARRVSAESIALVFAVREPSRLPELDGLPAHALKGLGESDARALLAAAVRAPLDERVRARILAEARGNPLALVELPRTAGLAGMAGGFAQPDSIPGVIEQSFRARLELLPPAARLLVTVAAADPIGDPGLLWRAAELLGIDAAAAAAAVPLVEFGTRIRFSHPLARSAAYRAATPEERRGAHEALAAVTDPVADPDRRAWHRAQASAGPDEEVAAELEASATRAQERGGVAAAAAFLERSAALTISPVQRTERTLAAVRAKLSVGDFDTAADLLTTVRTDDPGQAARADLLRGRLSFARRRGDEGPTAHLLRAAARLATTDPAWSRECSLDAIEMGLLLGGFEEVVEAVREASRGDEPDSRTEAPPGATAPGLGTPGPGTHGPGAPGVAAPGPGMHGPETSVTAAPCVTAPGPEALDSATSAPGTHGPEAPGATAPGLGTPSRGTSDSATPGVTASDPGPPSLEALGSAAPDSGTPSPEAPDSGTPSPETPDPAAPGVTAPGSGALGLGTPGPETSDAAAPGPGTPSPKAPAPGTPSPKTPIPETSDSATPSVTAPAPGTHGPGMPSPEAPASAAPNAGSPGPGTPSPQPPAPAVSAEPRPAPAPPRAKAPLPPPSGTPAVLSGLIRLVRDGHARAGDILGPVVGDVGAEVWARRPSLGFMLATELWNFDSLYGIAARAAAAGRGAGSFHALPIALAMQATAAVHRGDFGAAMELISEEEAIADATGAAPLVYPRLHLAALRGRREEALTLFASVDHRMSLSVQWATAVLSNGLADYPAALKAAQQAFAYGAVGTAGLALPELVEAAVRCGEPKTAAAAHATLRQRTQAGRQAWGLGVEACARALVTGDESAYQEAIALLDDGALVVYRARAHLLYGEWLRRQGRRRDARSALRLAHGALSELGMEAFAERAAGELRATGEQARSRASKATDQLTMQETHIARLVADGATSKEVAAKLFLSPRTVDAHLRNIFRKLGLTSRRQLRDLPEIR